MFHHLRCMLVTLCLMSYMGCTSIDAIPPSALARDLHCGSTEELVAECSKELPEHLINFLHNFKINITKEEKFTKCDILNGAARCLTQRKKNSLNFYVDGARLFLRKYCSDEEFQKDYLRHKECFSKLQSDWIGCTMEFKKTLAEDDLDDNVGSMSHKFMECCCARYSFVNCIHNSARLKCNQQSVAYVRKAARIFTDERHLDNCRHLEVACAAAARITRLGNSLMPLVTVLILRIVSW